MCGEAQEWSGDRDPEGKQAEAEGDEKTGFSDGKHTGWHTNNVHVCVSRIKKVWYQTRSSLQIRERQERHINNNF